MFPVFVVVEPPRLAIVVTDCHTGALPLLTLTSRWKYSFFR